MKISEFQEHIRKLYLERDPSRGFEKTFLWLIEEVGELAEALREGEKEKISEEIADVIAWVTSIANLCEIDVENSLTRKYKVSE